MLLCELFDSDTPSVMGGLRRAALDFFTPKAAHGLKFVTVAALIDALKAAGSGIHVDRRLVMDIIDPDKMPMVTKVEGDRVYLNVASDDDGDGNDRMVDDDQEARDDQHVSDMAAKAAKQSISDK